MDNESFRYLAALKHGLNFKEDEDRIYAASWDKARSKVLILSHNPFRLNNSSF